MSNAHFAKNAKNQPLVDAMTVVLMHGPTFPEYGSCHNVQHILERENENVDWVEAYRASEAYAGSLGAGIHEEIAYPVEQRLSKMDGGEPYQYKHMPKWEGYVGAMRRQWLHEVREFVKQSEETF